MVAERLLDLGIESEIHTGEAWEMVDEWSGVGEVIVVDAVVTGAPVGTVHLWYGWQAAVPRNLPVSTHGFCVADAIELARAIGRLPRRLQVYGIEGRQFGLGKEVSPEVEHAVEIVAEKIAAEAGISRACSGCPSTPDP